MRLRIFLCAFKIPNKLFGAVAGNQTFCLSLVIALRSVNKFSSVVAGD